MFISEDEAARRLNSTQNILTSLRKEGPEAPSVPDPEVHEPDEILPADDAQCASAQDIIKPAALRRLLGIGTNATGYGRKVGQREMPKEMQAAAATTAQLVDTRTAAREFDMSYHHADELKHGFTSQDARYNKQDPDKELDIIIKRQKKEVRDLAFSKLTKTLGLMSDDKLTAITDATKLSRVAKDLAGVVDKVLPKEDNGNLGGVHFHVWRPGMKTEEDYETVTVGAPR